MAFVFRVEKAGEIRSSKIYYVEGTLESGRTLMGTAEVDGDSSRRVTIKSIANVCSDPLRPGYLTASIEKPSFPIKQLVGTRLLGPATGE